MGSASSTEKKSDITEKQPNYVFNCESNFT